MLKERERKEEWVRHPPPKSGSTATAHQKGLSCQGLPSFRTIIVSTHHMQQPGEIVASTGRLQQIPKVQQLEAVSQ